MGKTVYNYEHIYQSIKAQPFSLRVEESRAVPAAQFLGNSDQIY